MRAKPLIRRAALAALACAGLLLADRAPADLGGVIPPTPPRPTAPQGTVLFSDDFADGKLDRWSADRENVWAVRYGMLRATLPDERQLHSLLYAGSEEWTNYAIDLDVCGLRGVDKGVVVRVEGESGIGLDLRGPGYQDALLHRREWPMGRARVTNANGVWHHVRIEARGHRYRVWVDEALVIDRTDGRGSRPKGRIALAAYTGGVGECLVYYDNVVVTELSSTAGDITSSGEAGAR
jgi:hypothetical protein